MAGLPEDGGYGLVGDGRNGSGKRVIKARAKFTRCQLSGGTVVHRVTNVYLRWWTGHWPESLEVTVALACSGRQPEAVAVRSLPDRTAVTCSVCRRHPAPGDPKS